MKLLNRLRYCGWYLLELFKRDSIYKRKQFIEKMIEDDAFYFNHINSIVQNLLDYASANTDFYKKYKGLKLQDYPVINKNVVMDNYDKITSSIFEGKKTHQMSTSGSTGRPFVVKQDFGKRRQVLAEILYFSGLLGYIPGKKFVYLRNLESGFSKSSIKKFLQNEDIISTQKYDDVSINKIVRRLSELESDTTVLGYASTLHVISNYMSDKKIKINKISGIISGAEAITTKTRHMVQSCFNCPVVSRYSNQEMGILAQDAEENEFLLNRSDYYFELLDLNSDEPVKDGDMGRIVITDLYNRAMPLIRYDTGDLGIMSTDEKGTKILVKVLGRKLDLLYTTKNEPLSFFALDDIFENNYDIEQYQIIQEGRCKITLNLILKNGKSIDENQTMKSVQSIMGEDCSVSFHYLNTVPITSSGKFRYVICNYSPDHNAE